MNIDKLERANLLAKSLIPKVDKLLNTIPKSSGKVIADAVVIADAILVISQRDMEFGTKFKQLLNETKQRLQKEFDEL